MGALQALAAVVLRSLGPLVRRGTIPALGGFGGVGLGRSVFGDDAVVPGIIGEEPRRRRRRRRVLTSNDRADISFITATLGAPAGKAFAMIVAARV